MISILISGREFSLPTRPKAIVTRLNSTINEVIALPGVRDHLVGAGADLMLLSPDQMGVLPLRLPVYQDFLEADLNRSESRSSLQILRGLNV